MRVDIPEAPASFRQALREGAPVFTDHERGMAELLSSATVGLPLFTASLDDVKNGQKPKEEPSTTWRFMARDPEGHVIFGEVSNLKGLPKLVRVSKDPRSLLVLNATADINQRSELPDDHYQLRLSGYRVSSWKRFGSTRRRGRRTGSSPYSPHRTSCASITRIRPTNSSRDSGT